MTTNMQCLKDIVGVTKYDTECLTGGLDAETLAKLHASTSGIYMDDLPGGVHLKALKYIDSARSMADMGLTARDNAIKTMQDDLVVALNERYKQGRKSYIGQVGRMSYAQTLPGGNRWQGLRIRPNDFNDAIMTVRRITVIMDQAVTFTLRLLRVPVDSVMGEEIGSWQFTTTANAYKSIDLETPLRLPFTVSDGNALVEYWLIYDTEESGQSFRPKDTKIGCNSCNSVAADVLEQYVKVWGVTVNDPSQLTGKTQDSYSHGIILDVDVRCDTNTLFCREYDENNAVAVAMARAVWYKAGELLIEEVLKSPDVNRYTTMAKEYLWGKRNHFRAEYDQRIIYLSASVDVSASNCYICRDVPNNPAYTGIYS